MQGTKKARRRFLREVEEVDQEPYSDVVQVGEGKKEIEKKEKEMEVKMKCSRLREDKCIIQHLILDSMCLYLRNYYIIM